MAINIYLSTIESKKQTKEIRRTEIDSWIWRGFDGCQLGGDMGEWVKR